MYGIRYNILKCPDEKHFQNLKVLIKNKHRTYILCSYQKIFTAEIPEEKFINKISNKKINKRNKSITSRYIYKCKYLSKNLIKFNLILFISQIKIRFYTNYVYIIC